MAMQRVHLKKAIGRHVNNLLTAIAAAADAAASEAAAAAAAEAAAATADDSPQLSTLINVKRYQNRNPV